MSARRRRYRRRGAFGPNMTPMVDVVLVILIFFMGAMGLAAAEQFLGTGVPPPDASPRAASSSSEADATPDSTPGAGVSRAILRMTVGPGGRTVVNGMGLTDVGLDAVADRLEAIVRAGFDDSVIVVVAPAARVPYQDVVLVHDAAARAGITNIRLGVVE